MALFPATTMMTPVVGLDFHKVIIPPAPITPPLPHASIAPILLWLTPKWPVMNVLVNYMPAACSGSIGYGVHIPLGAPGPEGATNTAFWKRWLLNIPMALVLILATTLANLIVAGIAAAIGKWHKGTEAFLVKVTGIDASSKKALLNSIQAQVDSYKNFSTWIKLLMAALPYPVAHVSQALGSTGVKVHGGLFGFTMPGSAISCTEIPFILAPNAMPLGSKNVLVGVSAAAILEQLAVGFLQRGIGALAAKGVERGAKAVGLSH
jgi:hypothetical protein